MHNVPSLVNFKLRACARAMVRLSHGVTRVVLALVCMTACEVHAQQPAWPDPAFTNEVIVVPLEGHSISALITHKPGASQFTHAVAIFPGEPGRGNLRVD